MVYIKMLYIILSIWKQAQYEAMLQVLHITHSKDNGILLMYTYAI